MFEIFFISYQEPNADKNWLSLKSRFPTAQRVHGVKGICQAHQVAAKKSFTRMFWVVDGDAEILDNFNFDFKLPVYGGKEYDTDCVHVWHSKNPINDLIYGYGGVKLLPTSLTKKMNISVLDMTTSISNNFKSISEVSNVTAFSTDPFNTWKSAFRECVKLSSKSINKQNDSESDFRLNTWCTVGVDRPFGKYAIDGATEGKNFGKLNIGNFDELSKINNFDWLLEKFNERQI
jgi:hypothetical protein